MFTSAVSTPSPPLRIAVVGHVRFPIAAPFAGGMEAFTHGLVTGLLARGHNVRLFAAGDSDPCLPVEPILPEHYERDMPWGQWHGTSRFARRQRSIFETCADRLAEFVPDVVHNNSLSSDLIGLTRGIPMVTTLHVPPFRELADAVARSLDEPARRYATVSEAQLSRWSPDMHPSFSAVFNGVDVDHWRPRGPKGDRAIWSGRITPTKGTGDAVRAAQRAGIGLDLYGPIEDEHYFERDVVPCLDKDIRYGGTVDAAALAARVAEAAVALVTPKWDEPFGLVAAEALACGTPVAGYARGAVPEVVGDCGVLVPEGDVVGLAEAIAAARSIEPSACRNRGLLFCRNRMIDAYEALYASAIASRSSMARTELELA